MKKILNRRLIVFISLLLLFLWVSRFFYVTFWLLLEDYGSGEGGGHFALFSSVYPFYLHTLTLFFALFAYSFTAFSPLKRKAKQCRIYGSILIALGIILLIALISKLVKNEYYFGMLSLTEMFPGDLIAYSLIFVILGALAIVYSFRLKEVSLNRPSEKRIKRILRRVLVVFYVIFTAFYTGDLIALPMTLDRSMKYFGGMFAVYLLMSVPIASIIIYGFFSYYKEEEWWQSLHSKIITLVIPLTALILGGWILIFEVFSPNFLTEAGTAVFPLDHMLQDSIAFGPIVVLSLSLLGPLMSFLFSLPHKKTFDISESDNK